MRLLSNYNVITFFLIALSQFITGCNLTYKVRNQYHKIDETFYFPCGKVTVELIGKGNSKFIFRQQFDLDNNAIVYADSLKIIYNGKQIIAKHNLKNSEEGKGGKEIEKNKSWETSFEFEKGVFEGDTILISGPAYVRCNGDVITLNTMVYAFINNLRIYGVNDF